jgi:hypothetical protein
MVVAIVLGMSGPICGVSPGSVARTTGLRARASYEELTADLSCPDFLVLRVEENC